MNLEQRVQALEQEVQLLKAQIQTTLLDIQEQLLNGTYPALRADDPAKIVTPPEPIPETQPKPVPNTNRFKTISIKDTEPEVGDDDEPDEIELPVHTVDHHKPAVSPQPPLPDPSPKLKVERSEHREPPELIKQTERALLRQDVTGHDWIELENWVGQKLERLGIKRTRELIRLYAREERFSQQESELLMEFVNIYAEIGNDGQVPPFITYGNDIEERPSIVPQTRAVVEEIRDDLREKQGKTRRGSGASTFSLSERQELILRLIAGILTAGDGVPSSNGHGNY